MIASFTFHVAHPLWLLAALAVVPAILLAWRPLEAVGPTRRAVVVAVRALVILLLALLLAEPLLARRHDQVTLIAVIDRSQSVPEKLGEAAVQYVTEGLKDLNTGGRDDRVALIDTAESPVIEQLASTQGKVRQRVEALSGDQTNLAAAVQLGMAIAPPDRAARMLLVSDGNETTGDLRAAARVAAANRIPIDVLPLRYHHTQEVIFSRLVSPPTAESGQTVALRFVLSSTGPARGRIHLAQNGESININPGGDGTDAPVLLKEGTNVKTISLPVANRGLHEYEATFIPDDPSQDTLAQNNRASSMTYVSGPGHIMVVDEDGESGKRLASALPREYVSYESVKSFPTSLARLLDVDAVVLANTSCGEFSLEQQQMLCDYVKELGGGLVMVGGPQAFGAGGWIGSPVAEVLPVDMDPPQKKQMPKGALVLVMHACEMPQGNYWGKEVALAAVGTLSRLDLAGVMSYNWNDRRSWDYSLAPVGDKTGVFAAIKQMQMGDMPDFGLPIQEAYSALVACDAGQKHVIVISDGDPQPPSDALLAQCKAANITITGVAVFPHMGDPAAVKSLVDMAQKTGGRFYLVNDPNMLPQIFIKEAQTVKKALIQEEPFTPRVVGGTSEILRGLPALPQLKGHVLTGPKGGLAETLVLGPDDDPILASWQAGVGRAVAMTAGADGRWAPEWITWGGYDRFWEQTLRWVAKSRQPPDCVVFADVDGRTVTVTVEGVDRAGNFVQFSAITGRTIGPDMEAKELPLTQTGPGQYRGTFTAGGAGSYLVNLRYQKAGTTNWNTVPSVVSVPYAPEFRDLADNTPLLEEVAHETGGRILPPDPKGVDLFDRAGLSLPETPLPLTRPLLALIVALFVIDVACRRLALDARAMAAAAAGRVRRLWPKRTAVQDARLAQLKDRTLTVRGQLKSTAADRPLAAAPPVKTTGAGRRFEAPEGAAAELPDSAKEAPRASRPAATAPAKPATAPEQRSDGSHLDQLLKARRQARKGPGQDEPKKT